MESKVLFEYEIPLWRGGVQLILAALPINAVAFALLANWLGLILGLIISFGSTSLLIYYWISKDKSSFRIYDNRISFFNPLEPLKEYDFLLEDIFQARYEDPDNWFSPVKGIMTIFLYLKPNHTYQSKIINAHNRLTIVMTTNNIPNDVIEILRIFQSKDKQVYILTKSKKIKETLGLENWDLSK